MFIVLGNEFAAFACNVCKHFTARPSRTRIRSATIRASFPRCLNRLAVFTLRKKWGRIMKRARCMVLVLLAGTVALAADDKAKLFKFDKADAGKLPTGWKAAQTGKGESVWKVVADDTAPSKSGYALAQTTDNPDALFNLCVVNDTNFKDVEASVSFKANKGKNDQGGGIVWRYQDANNYYVCRMNPLESNFRVYKVVDGKRAKEFQNADVKIPAN